MAETEPLAFPIGRYGGRNRQFDDFMIRRGPRQAAVTVVDYLVWQVAHGSAAEDVRWTPATVVTAAREMGTKHADVGYTRMRDAGYIVEAPTSGAAAIEFADGHQMVPVAYAYGNTADDPYSYGLGPPSKPILWVPPHIWWLWSHSHLEASLWQACRSFVERGVVIGDADAAQLAPEDVLTSALKMMHTLLCIQAVYLDRRRGGEDGGS